MEGNVIENGNFMKREIGGLPLGWDIVYPNRGLAPKLKLEKGVTATYLWVKEMAGANVTDLSGIPWPFLRTRHIG